MVSQKQVRTVIQIPLFLVAITTEIATDTNDDNEFDHDEIMSSDADKEPSPAPAPPTDLDEIYRQIRQAGKSIAEITNYD